MLGMLAFTFSIVRGMAIADSVTLPLDSHEQNSHADWWTVVVNHLSLRIGAIMAGCAGAQ